jgi:uncharacterized membrane protein
MVRLSPLLRPLVGAVLIAEGASAAGGPGLAAKDAKPMQKVTDAFLLNMAEVSAGLIGLFLVGVFFWIETGFRRLGDEGEVFEDYFQASTRIVMILFAIPLLLSITLVTLEETWSTVLFAVLCVVLIAANVDTVRQIMDVQRVSDSNLLYINEVLGTLGVAVLVATPWILGGLDPSREDLTWAILVSFLTAFVSVLAVVMSVFDVARTQRLRAPGPGVSE